MPALTSLMALARVLYFDPREAIERVETASRVPLDLSDLSLDDLDKQASEHFWAGDFRGALARYSAILEHLVLAPPKDDAVRSKRHAEVELRSAATLLRCGALHAARSTAERAINLALKLPELQVQAYCVLTDAHIELGNQQIAIDTGGRAVTLSEGRDEEVQIQALMAKGRALLEAGQFEPARQAYLKARERLTHRADDLHLTHVEGSIGLCLLGLGRRRLARASIDRALLFARRHAMPILEVQWRIELGRISLEEGKLDEADAQCAAALRMAKPREHWLTIFQAEWLRHRIVKRREPGNPDRNRFRLLRKLLVHLDAHAGNQDVQAFRSSLVAAASNRPRSNQ